MNEHMLYRRGAGDDMISILGFGCMRFTKRGTAIDLDKAEQEVMTAIRGGVNYLDTAYIYPGSEAAVGKILERNRCRDQVYIATKLPQYLIKSAAGIEKTFQEELTRLRTDHIDYYLMHMITDVAQWEKLDRLGIRDWIAQKKASGQIRHIGFSYHGSTDMFLKVLNAYDWEFCQIQYNYLDEHSQAGRRGLEAAHEKGIPVIIMEPLRGGKLANKLPASALNMIKANPRGYTAPEWSFRWLWNQEAVTCVLSGMNSVQMVAENLQTASDAHANSFTEADFAFIDALKTEINANTRVGCTGCGYCMPCPNGVDIPGTFRCLNEIKIDGKFAALREYYQTTAIRKVSACASMCVGCGKCERHCPQQLPIREYLKQAAKELETPVYRVARRLVSLWRPW